MVKHIVKSGETLSGIANHYHIDDWRVIYNHPDNAAFRAKRPDPDLIYPGDEIWIEGEGGPESHKGLGPIETIIGVQRRLNLKGFDAGPNDNIYGPKTKVGVKRFQQFCKENHHGIDETIIDSGPVDGIFGPLSRAALLQYYGL